MNNLTSKHLNLINNNINCSAFELLPKKWENSEKGLCMVLDIENLNNYQKEYLIKTMNENFKIIEDIEKSRLNSSKMLIGDYVLLPDGQYKRIGTWLGDKFQITDGHSFWAKEDSASFSGGFNFNYPKLNFKPKNFKKTGSKEAYFWTFSKGSWKAGNGIYFTVKTNVWSYI